MKEVGPKSSIRKPASLAPGDGIGRTEADVDARVSGKRSAIHRSTWGRIGGEENNSQGAVRVDRTHVRGVEARPFDGA